MDKNEEHDRSAGYAWLILIAVISCLVFFGLGPVVMGGTVTLIVKVVHDAWMGDIGK